ncbi:AfsR/SARP family transcriptional regulator [Actinomadura roseirufa]|uniref:AfsR/SARP family transcriptional regulator n=1 Tax=Actinomadura roseirufa TaxID=2094049 RepID=UPI001A9556C2|nr:AfsR/SARP family transcriptional regulator [Actinomadura roseirufa]
MIRYGVLGPLRVARERPLALIGSRKSQVALTLMLIKATEIVSTDEMIAEIWGQSPPARASAGIHVAISQLRKYLGSPGGTSPIVTAAPGYMLRLDGAELDLRAFQRRLERGREAARAHRDELALRELEGALELWRGPLLLDQRDGPQVGAFVTWAEEARLDCVEMMVDAALRLGRHREYIGMLQRMVAEHALHEGFHYRLMLALYRSGRRADALLAYRAARETLVRELGLEPGAELRRLNQAILQDERVTDLRGAA